MNLVFASLGFLIFIFGILYLSDKFSPTTLSSESINSSPFILFFSGVFFTALCQSSSATGIVVLLLHDKKVLTLKQTAMFLIGGNLGTTISGQIFSFSTGDLIPILVILTGLIGIIKNRMDKLASLFHFLVSFSCIIFGLNILKETADHYSGFFISLFKYIETEPGIFLFGCITTAIFQSSSLVIGFLIILIESDIITLKEALLAAFGVNIGTCSTLLLVSTGLGEGGRRGAIFQFLFNVMGVALFIAILPYFISFIEYTGSTQARLLANAHTSFNLITAILLVLSWDYMEKTICKLY